VPRSQTGRAASSFDPALKSSLSGLTPDTPEHFLKKIAALKGVFRIEKRWGETFRSQSTMITINKKFKYEKITDPS
jgi:hypothetical protein